MAPAAARDGEDEGKEAAAEAVDGDSAAADGAETRVEGETEDGEGVSNALPELGVRQCRCMFCGENIPCEKEEDSIKHLEACAALTQQLAGKGQFTMPEGALPQNDHPRL